MNNTIHLKFEKDPKSDVITFWIVIQHPMNDNAITLQQNNTKSPLKNLNQRNQNDSSLPNFDIPESAKNIPLVPNNGAEYITQVEVQLNRKTVILVDTSANLSENPYFSFKARGFLGDNYQINYINNLGQQDRKSGIIT